MGRPNRGILPQRARARAPHACIELVGSCGNEIRVHGGCFYWRGRPKPDNDEDDDGDDDDNNDKDDDDEEDTRRTTRTRTITRTTRAMTTANAKYFC